MFTPHPSFGSKRRAVGIAVFAVSLAGTFAGCADDDSATSTTLTSEPTGSAPLTTEESTDPDSPSANTVGSSVTEATAGQYTVVSGDTLVDIASRANVTLSDLIGVNGWADGADHLILPGDVIKLPAGASASASGNPITEPDTSASTTAASTGSPGGYSTALGQLGFTNGRTAEVTSPLVDGVYWAQGISANGSSVSFTLGQLFLCSPELATERPELDCSNGLAAQLTSPKAQATLASNASVLLITGGTGAPANLSITPAEYARLIVGAAPASDAPDGFEFNTTDVTLVQVSGGSVLTVEQTYIS